MAAAAVAAVLQLSPRPFPIAAVRPRGRRVRPDLPQERRRQADQLGAGRQGRRRRTTTRRAFKPIDGLTMDLVASEPVIRQPVDLHFDDRGRLWVVQYLQYPFPAGLTITSYDQYLRARYNARAGGATPPRPGRGQDHRARGHGRRRHVRLAQGRHHRPQHHDQRVDRARRRLGDEPAATCCSIATRPGMACPTATPKCACRGSASRTRTRSPTA